MALCTFETLSFISTDSTLTGTTFPELQFQCQLSKSIISNLNFKSFVVQLLTEICKPFHNLQKEHGG
jgi:hypothetical protein